MLKDFRFDRSIQCCHHRLDSSCTSWKVFQCIFAAGIMSGFIKNALSRLLPGGRVSLPPCRRINGRADQMPLDTASGWP